MSREMNPDNHIYGSTKVYDVYNNETPCQECNKETPCQECNKETPCQECNKETPCQECNTYKSCDLDGNCDMINTNIPRLTYNFNSFRFLFLFP
jgi:hypothetical protein